MALLGDEDPSGEVTGDRSLAGQSQIKELLAFSKEGHEHLASESGRTGRVVVVQTPPVTSSFMDMEVTEEHYGTSKSTTVMKMHVTMAA